MACPAGCTHVSRCIAGQQKVGETQPCCHKTLLAAWLKRSTADPWASGRQWPAVTAAHSAPAPGTRHMHEWARLLLDAADPFLGTEECSRPAAAVQTPEKSSCLQAILMPCLAVSLASTQLCVASLPVL